MRKTAIRSLTLVVALLALAPAAGAYYSGRPIPGDPLAGHPWFVDKQRGSWWVALRTQPRLAAALRPFADNPMGKTIGVFDPHPTAAVSQYIARALRAQPGSIPFINLDRIEGSSCPYPGNQPGYSEHEIESWVRGFSRGIGDHRVMVIVETDKLTTIRCLPRWARARRFRELSFEVRLLHDHNPKAIVYIDAGSADWGKNAATIARWLRRADVAQAQGFALNASHFDWTSKEVKFGRQVSRRLGGKHFVVNTDVNGWGPNSRGPIPSYYHKGCTPPGEGLGIVPTVRTGSRRVDAFLWLGTPGYTNGRCLGYGLHAPYKFYLALAVSLALHANPPAPR
jgi:endoglucanase